MKTITLNAGVTDVVASVATIGMFDGVHRGHRFVVGQVMQEARRRDLQSTIVTFDRHPRTVVQQGWLPQLLCTPEQRRQRLAAEGVDRLVVLPFTAEMAACTARDFLRLLAERLGVRVLLMGYDNRFGRRADESFADYVGYGAAVGIEVRQLPSDAFRWEGQAVNSSLIRRLLGEGRVADAACCLGERYQLVGTVVSGEHVGTRLGYPTANIRLSEPLQMLPREGAYAVSVMLHGDEGAAVRSWRGMMNIGTRPTFGEHDATLEVHLLDFEGNLYGRQLTVSFVERLRDERRFGSPEALAAQLSADEQRVRQMTI